MTTSTVPAERTATRQPEETVRAAIVIGSIREDRFGPVPAAWIAERAREHRGLEIDLIDLADHELPAVLGGNDPDAPEPEQVTRLGARLAEADGFIVVTPVYNRSYPASLKNAIDWFHPEWQLKPVGFVSYGGITAGLQAIEALRGVFTEFHAIAMRDSITIANFWDAFDHDGRPVDSERMASLADGFLDQLAWWATALREARRNRPYPFAESA